MIKLQMVMLRWWPLLLAMLTFAVAYGSNLNQIASNRESLEAMITCVGGNERRLDEVEASISSIDTNIEWIRYTLEREYGNEQSP